MYLSYINSNKCEWMEKKPMKLDPSEIYGLFERQNGLSSCIFFHEWNEYIIGTRYTLFNEVFYMEWLNRQVFALVKQWHIVLLLNHGRWRSYSGVSGWGRTAGCGDQRRGNVVAQLAGNFHQNRSHWLWRSTWRRKKSQNRKIDKVLLLLESYEG